MSYFYEGTPPSTQPDGSVFVTCIGQSQVDPRFSNDPGAIARGTGEVTVRLVLVAQAPTTTSGLYCVMVQDGTHVPFYAVSFPYSIDWSPQSTSHPAQVYVVQVGDTFNGIAAKFGLSPGQLASANPQVTDPNAIHAGDTLNIP